MARAPALIEAEAIPEADRLDGFPHPRETRILLGHETAEAELAGTFARGRMHHAWLLAGAAGGREATLPLPLLGPVPRKPDRPGRPRPPPLPARAPGPRRP